MVEQRIQLYLDSSAIVDCCLESETRYQSGQRLLQICENYLSNLTLVVSPWAEIEAQGVIYKKLLEREGITRDGEINSKKQAGRDPRTYFPPKAEHLQESERIVASTLQNMVERCQVRSVLSENPEQASEVFRIARRIAVLTAIFPPDSLHLAIAINELVDYLVITDGDFLDKVRWPDHQAGITQLLQDSAYPNKPPQLKALPLQKLARATTRMDFPKNETNIIQVLEAMGFS